MDDLNQKLNSVYPGKVVRKDLYQTMFWAFCLSNFSTVLNVETYILYDFENVVRNPGLSAGTG
jgi:predicted ATP-dependent Lon-type protease